MDWFFYAPTMAYDRWFLQMYHLKWNYTVAAHNPLPIVYSIKSPRVVWLCGYIEYRAATIQLKLNKRLWLSIAWLLQQQNNAIFYLKLKETAGVFSLTIYLIESMRNVNKISKYNSLPRAKSIVSVTWKSARARSQTIRVVLNFAFISSVAFSHHDKTALKRFDMKTQFSY